MPETDAQRYERLVGRLVDEIRKRVPDLTTSGLRIGGKCHIEGASGFSHQIDVVVESPSHIVLVECKHWTKKIRAQEVLVLKGRQADIQDANPGCRVEAFFATKLGATQDAGVLARYFGFDLGVVSSEKEFALRVGRHLSVGVSDGLRASDSAEAVVGRGNKQAL
jgi:hypothetical protein